MRNNGYFTVSANMFCHAQPLYTVINLEVYILCQNKWDFHKIIHGAIHIVFLLVSNQVFLVFPFSVHMSGVSCVLSVFVFKLSLPSQFVFS